MVKQLTKERQYNKIDNISRLQGGLATKGTTIFTKEYQGLTFTSRMAKSALVASDNGRCWWIRDYILGDAKAGKNTHAVIYEGYGQELYPSKAYK
jgi:hypothetical protein